MCYLRPMHSSSSIAGFIAHARSKGMDHQTIRMLLLSAGWKERDVSQALASESLEMPVPQPPDAGSARDAFFHLLSFTALTATVGSLVYLLFDYLNRWLPDPAFPQYGISDFSGIRWSIAVILLSFPLFLWMQRLLQREFSEHPEKLASGVRKWLTYLTLFVTACTLVGDGISLIFSLLQGDMTLRFFLKVIVILVLAGLPFSYYLQTLRLPSEGFTLHPIHRRMLLLSTAIVLIVVVWGFLITGGPLYGRLQRYDAERLSDLQTIQNGIHELVFGYAYDVNPSPVPLPNPLPPSLEDAAARVTGQRLHIVDPQTQEPYEYRLTSDHSFDLCAVFALPRDTEYDVSWNHPSGRACFSFDYAKTGPKAVPARTKP